MDIDRVEQLQVDLESNRQRATKLESDLMQLRVKLEEAQLSATNYSERLRLAKETMEMQQARLSEL